MDFPIFGGTAGDNSSFAPAPVPNGQTKDAHRAHNARSFCYIGKILCPIISYEMIKTGRNNEASSCHVKMNLDNIDPSTFADNSVVKDLVEVQIWTGYLTDTSSPQKQMDELNRAIANGTTQDKFRKRFDGYITQPEFTHGMERTLEIHCLDWIGLLRDYKYYYNFKDGNSECRNVLNAIKKDLTGLTITMDSYSGNKNLGDLNAGGKTYLYSSIGKTYWNILEDIALRTGNKIITEGKNIFITKYKKQPVIWNMYYGSASNQKKGGEQQGQYFEKVHVRFGEKGKIDKSNVVVDVFGTNHTKKGNARKVLVRYPDHADVMPTTDYISVSLPGDIRIEGAKQWAEDIYREHSARLVTVTVDLPFGNPFMDLHDIMQFKADNSQVDMFYLDNIWFGIETITESYSIEGYKQSIEGNSDPTLEKTLTAKVVPIYEVGPTNRQLGIAGPG